MDIVGTYQRKVLKSKEFIVASVGLIMVLRIVLFINIGDFSTYSHTGTSLFGDTIFSLWDKNSWLSFILATGCALGVTFYSAYISIRYTLIRIKSYLVYILSFLLFSSNAAFLVMNMQYVAILFFLVCLDLLFTSYQQKNIAGKAYIVGFMLAVSSLFSFYFLSYIVVFWVGFMFMRNFSFKVFVASLLGVISIYWFVFFYYWWINDMESFFNLFPAFSSAFEIGNHLKILSLRESVFFALNLFFLTIAIFFNQFYSYKDKIRVRVKILFLDLLAVLAILSSMLIKLNFVADLYIYTVSYSLIASHFFSVAEHKWQVYFLYTFLIFNLCVPILIYLN